MFLRELSFRQKVFANRREAIDQRSRLDSNDTVRNVCRRDKAVTRYNSSAVVSHRHVERSSRDIRCLSVRVMMHSTDCSSLEVHAHEHEVSANGEDLSLHSFRSRFPLNLTAAEKRSFNVSQVLFLTLLPVRRVARQVK
jgi:hypothetical protein